MMTLVNQRNLILRPVELLEFSVPRALAKSQSQHAQRKLVVKIN
jgi:hypothetical protein